MIDFDWYRNDWLEIINKKFYRKVLQKFKLII